MLPDPNKTLSALLGILLGLLAFALAVPWMGGYLHPPQEESAASLEEAQPFPSEKPLLPQAPSASPQDPTSLIKKDSAGSLPQEEATQQEGRQRGKKIKREEEKSEKKALEELEFQGEKVAGGTGSKLKGLNDAFSFESQAVPKQTLGGLTPIVRKKGTASFEEGERKRGEGQTEQRGRFASIPEAKFPEKSGGKQEADLEIKELKKAEQRSASPTEPEKTLVADAGRQRLPPIGRPSGGTPSGSTGGVGTGTPIPDPLPNVETCENCRTICPGDTCPEGFECDTLNCPAAGACSSDGSGNVQCIRCEAQLCDGSDCPPECNGNCTRLNPCPNGQVCDTSGSGAPRCIDCTGQYCDGSDCPQICKDAGICSHPTCSTWKACDSERTPPECVLVCRSRNCNNELRPAGCVEINPIPEIPDGVAYCKQQDPCKTCRFGIVGAFGGVDYVCLPDYSGCPSCTNCTRCHCSNQGGTAVYSCLSCGGSCPPGQVPSGTCTFTPFGNPICINYTCVTP